MSASPPPVSETEIGDYELRIPRTFWQRWFASLKTPRGAVLVAGALVIGVALWQAPEIYRATKIWRVRTLIKKSELERDAGNTESEARLLRQAFGLLPGHVLTLRARADHFERLGDSGALIVYHRLLLAEDSTLIDAVRACRLAALRGSADAGEQILAAAERIPGAPGHAATLSLRARLLMARGMLREGVALAEESVGLDSAGAHERLLMAMVLLQSSSGQIDERNDEAMRRAVGILAEVARTNDAPALDALNALVSLKHHKNASQVLAEYNVAEWIKAVREHPRATPVQRVRAWDLKFVVGKQSRDEIISGFVESWKDAPARDALEAARWLTTNDAPRASLEISGPWKESSEEWFLANLEALAGAGDWKAVVEQLDRASGPAMSLSKVLHKLFRMTALARLGEAVDIDETWRDIHTQLRMEPVRIQVFVAHYAEASGERRHAEAIFRAIIRDTTSEASLDQNLNRETKSACCAGLLRTMKPTAPAEELLPVLMALVEGFPDNDALRDEASYARALVGPCDEALRVEVDRLRSERPSSQCLIAAAALVELRLGNQEAALKLSESEAFTGVKVPDRFKAVRTAVLIGAGKAAEADSLRRLVRENNLRPEEKALLEPPRVIPAEAENE